LNFKPIALKGDEGWSPGLSARHLYGKMVVNSKVKPLPLSQVERERETEKRRAAI